MVGYNVQRAVDTKHHLFVTHEVTNVGSDRNQLSRKFEQAREAIGFEAIEALADRGGAVSIARRPAQEAEAGTVTLRTEPDQRSRRAPDRCRRHEAGVVLQRLHAARGADIAAVLRHVGRAIGAVDDGVAGLFGGRGTGDRSR